MQNNQNSWIDGHCHLADARFKDSLPQIIARSERVGVRGWVQGGVSPDEWERQLEIQKEFGPRVITSFGVHPWRVAQSPPEQLEKDLAALVARASEANALGEMGLDFSRGNGGKANFSQQCQAFERQLELAKDLGKPVVLHIVQAHSEALEILQKYSPLPGGGMVHSFSASQEILKSYLEMNFFISVSGAITQRGFQKLKNALNCVPIDRLIVETDAPDQLPALPHLLPSRLNEPANLVGIAAVLARLRGDTTEEILLQSTQNIKRLFKCQ